MHLTKRFDRNIEGNSFFFNSHKFDITDFKPRYENKLKEYLAFLAFDAFLLCLGNDVLSNLHENVYSWFVINSWRITLKCDFIYTCGFILMSSNAIFCI